MDDDIDVYDVFKLLLEFESVSFFVVGNEVVVVYIQNEEDDDFVFVFGFSVDICCVVEEDMFLLCEYREVFLCECEDVVDEEFEYVVVSLVFNEVSVVVQLYGLELVVVLILWFLFFGVDIEEIYESSDSLFVVE